MAELIGWLLALFVFIAVFIFIVAVIGVIAVTILAFITRKDFDIKDVLAEFKDGGF